MSMDWRLLFESGPWEWSASAAALLGLLFFRPVLRSLPLSLRCLRAASLLALALGLLKPALERLEERSLKPRLALLIDAGPSMQSKDDRGIPRIERAARWLLSRRGALEAAAEPVLYAASSGARRVGWEELPDLKATSASLDPAAAAGALLDEGPPPARVWLLSDGAFAHEEASEQALARLQAPVDALGIGPLKVKPALSVAALTAPDFVFLHGRFSLGASLEAVELAGSQVHVRLYKSGESAPLAERRFSPASPFEALQASFTAAAQSLGSQSYRVEASARLGGLRLAASRELRVEVIRQKHRIMYLAGRPSFEYSHLRALLKGDPNHELVSFVILRNPENASPVPDQELSLIPFPASEIFVQDLFQFDLFILQNFDYLRFNLPPLYLQNLRRFVAEGGALLVLGGANAFTRGGYQGTALEETLPVALWPQADDFEPGVFSPEAVSPGHPLLNLGDSEQASAELWRSLPPLEGFARFQQVRPGAAVLLRHPERKTGSGEPLPVVAVRAFGKGKVMLVGTDSTWRWKLAGGRDWRLSSFYARFWNRAVQYLTGSLELKKVKFGPLPDRMPSKEPAVLSLRVFDEHFRPLAGSQAELEAAWTPPGGGRRPVAAFEKEPGVFQLELAGLAPGRHRVRALAKRQGRLWDEDEASFLWEEPKGEAPLERKKLSSLARRSGGRYADLEGADASEWLDSLGPPRLERRALSRTQLGPSRAWLWLLLALLFSEWFLRRRRGLL